MRFPRHLPAIDEFLPPGPPMREQSRSELANPYSPLMCALLLLVVFAAIQLKVFAVI
jgi:hypothetical protein